MNSLGLKLFAVAADAREISAEQVARCARDLTAEEIRCMSAGGRAPQGHLALLASPVHPSGMQLYWALATAPGRAPRLDLPALAEAVSRHGVRALYVEYVSTSCSGFALEFRGGRLRKRWGRPRESGSHRLDACLRRHFLMDLSGLSRWVGRWAQLHPFSPTHAPRYRAQMLEVLAPALGEPPEKLLEAVRAGNLPRDGKYRFLAQLSAQWRLYDHGVYPSRLFLLAAGTPADGGVSRVLREPAALTPDEWFDACDAWEESAAAEQPG